MYSLKQMLKKSKIETLLSSQDWTKKSGWRVYHGRERVVPGDPGFPKLSDRSKFSDYASRGFKDSPI